MLEEIDYTGKKRSKYICDRCGRRINTSSEKRYKLGIDTPKGNTSVMKSVKRYDLCKHCISAIVNYVEKKGK